MLKSLNLILVCWITRLTCHTWAGMMSLPLEQALFFPASIRHDTISCILILCRLSGRRTCLLPPITECNLRQRYDLKMYLEHNFIPKKVTNGASFYLKILLSLPDVAPSIDPLLAGSQPRPRQENNDRRHWLAASAKKLKQRPCRPQQLGACGDMNQFSTNYI